jgi:hypothetical protein
MSELITASQLAERLNMWPRHARRLLSAIPHQAEIAVRNKPTRAWLIADLPAELQERLAARKASPDPDQQISQPEIDLTLLADYARSFRLAGKPTDMERLSILDASFQFLADVAREHGEEHKFLLRRNIVRLLRREGVLTGSADASRVSFDRNYRRWLNRGRTTQAMEDARKRVKELDFEAQIIMEFDSDIKLLKALNARNGKMRRQSWRELHEKKHFSEPFRKRFPGRRVPGVIHRILSRDEAPLELAYRAPKKFRMKTGWIDIDPDGIAPGDEFVFDDYTSTCYWWDYNEAGEIVVQKGETLFAFDNRSWYPLGFVLVSKPYNSRHIRALLTQIHDRHGLPHLGYVFENGIWRARLINGDKDGHWSQTEIGLRELKGVRIRHTLPGNPTGKAVIERSFGLMQKKHRTLPGFAGFNERQENFEKVQELIRKVRSGKIDPNGVLLHKNEFSRALSASLEELASEELEGKYHRGKTPRQVWEQGLGIKPLRKLTPDTRYIIACHISRQKVGMNGITLWKGRDRFHYQNEATAELIGKEVFCYFDPECPNLLTVSDLSKQKFWSIERPRAALGTATHEDLKRAHSLVGRHRRPLKIKSDEIQHHYQATISNDNLYDEKSRSVGKFQQDEREKFETREREQETAEAREARQLKNRIAATRRLIQEEEEQSEAKI